MDTNVKPVQPVYRILYSLNVRTNPTSRPTPLHSSPPQQHHSQDSKSAAPQSQSGEIPSSTSCREQRLKDRHSGRSHRVPSDAGCRSRAGAIWESVHKKSSVRGIKCGSPEALDELENQRHSNWNSTIDYPPISNDCCYLPTIRPLGRKVLRLTQVQEAGKRVGLVPA